MSDSRYSYQVLDLFCGAGGTALGFHRAGFRVVGAVDIDPAAARTFQHNLGLAPLVADLAAISPQQLLHHFNLQADQIDVLVGCPPCQGFTRMRNDKGADDPRNDLVLRYLEFVEAIRPRCVVFENVPGLARQQHGSKVFRAFCHDLAALGYDVDPDNAGRVLNAADYGVPQLRKRLVLIAGRKPLHVPYPSPSHADPAHTRNLKAWVTVGEALAGLPPLEAGSKSDIPNHVARAMRSRVHNFIQLVPLNGGSRRDVPYEYWLPCHKKERCGHYDVYGRLASNAPAVVMTSGCTNVSKGRFAHPTQHRGITFREAARLQSFPDDFIFLGNWDDIDLQIGNAVPPLLAEAIAHTIRTALDCAKSPASCAAASQSTSAAHPPPPR